MTVVAIRNLWLRAALALVCAGALAVSAQAKEVAVAAGTARATIVAPLSVSSVQGIKFGRIVARATADTVTVDPVTGKCLVSGGIADVGSCQFATLAGMGGKNLTGRITLNSTVSLTGPGTTMVLDKITVGPNSTISLAGNASVAGGGIELTQGGGNQRFSITSNSGIFVLNIGGRLNVNANQTPGLYAGTIGLTVQYQ